MSDVRDWGVFRLHRGDCREVLATLAENSFDSCVTDPPYELGFMGKEWDRTGATMDPATWAAVLRVLKPGAFLLAFGGTRTFHRVACAIEDAGFELRDTIGNLHDAEAVEVSLRDCPWLVGWVYGSGFPKSRNGEWGGTALKPAWEPIIVARKPLAGTIEANWREHGTGALNIDGCRVGDANLVASYTSLAPCSGNRLGAASTTGARRGTQSEPKTYVGRWPANLVHDGSPAVVDAFPLAPGQLADASSSSRKTQNVYGAMRRGNEASANSKNEGAVGFKMRPGARRGDSGSAARFFYCPKAGRADRNAGATNHHPTVKPTELMRYLCRLVTPAGGRVLDAFTGSGSTGRGAVLEGFSFVGIDADSDGTYLDLAERRIAHAAFGPLAFGGPSK